MSLCTQALEDIGRDLKSWPDPLPVSLRERLQALWEWRCTTLEQVEKSKRQELTAFQWWFRSEKFPEDWSLAQMERSLNLCQRLEQTYGLVVQLAALSETYPLQTIRCFALLLEKGNMNWQPSSWPELIRTILRKAMECGLAEAEQLARTLIHRLGARGEDYRELLVQLPGSDDRIKEKRRRSDSLTSFECDFWHCSC